MNLRGGGGSKDNQHHALDCRYLTALLGDNLKKSKGAIMYGVFRTLHDTFRRVHNMYPHTIIYFVSCTLDLCSPYVASEMTNSKLVPKNPKISKKSKNFQKSQKIPKKAKFDKISQFLDNFGFFLANLAFLAFFGAFFAFLANFGFFGQFWIYLGFFGTFKISCSLHRGYI
jgi:hypothetical protein